MNSELSERQKFSELSVPSLNNQIIIIQQKLKSELLPLKFPSAQESPDPMFHFILHMISSQGDIKLGIFAIMAQVSKA
jgi:hypothetical protein